MHCSILQARTPGNRHHLGLAQALFDLTGRQVIDDILRAPQKIIVKYRIKLNKGSARYRLTSVLL